MRYHLLETEHAVVDPKKQAAEAGARAMIESGKDAAKRLYEDLTLTDEEKERRETERDAAKKKQRTRWIVYLVGGVILLLCLLMLLAKIWPYVLGLAVLAGLAYWGYRKLRGGSVEKAEDDAEQEAPPKRVAAPVEKVRVEAPTEEDLAAKAAAREAAAAEREREIDDELAALKKRAGK